MENYLLSCFRFSLAGIFTPKYISCFLFVIVLLAGCNYEKEGQVYDYGAFQIKLPKAPKDESLNSVDSYAAKITFDSVVLCFDYGRYSPKMTMSLNEHIESESWILDDNFIVGSALVDLRKRVLIRLDSISKNQLEACYHVDGSSMSERFTKYRTILEQHSMALRGDTLTYRFEIPKQLRECDFYIQEEDSIFSRVFLAQDFSRHSSGKYILDKKSCSDRLNCTRQLSIWVVEYGGIAREELLKILKSVELKN